MKISSIIILAVSHVVAFMATTIIIFAVPSVATLVSIASLDDPGGPLFVPAFAIMCFAAGVVVASLFFMYTIIFQLVGLKYKSPVILPPILSFPIICSIVLLLVPPFLHNRIIIATVIALILFALYILYWMLASVPSYLLNKFHTKNGKQFNNLLTTRRGCQ